MDSTFKQIIELEQEKIALKDQMLTLIQEAKSGFANIEDEPMREAWIERFDNYQRGVK